MALSRLVLAPGRLLLAPGRLLLALSRLVLAGGLCTLPAFAQVPAKCLVLDPELQKSYAGGCKDGKADGQGTAEGSAIYAGEFNEGRKHGRGVKTWPWGDRYQGEFADDAKHGTGIYTWGERSAFAGDRYEGGFAYDKRNGYGVYFWASGDSYAGPWKDDAVAGRATPMMIARFRATNESLAAMAKPGVRLCHESTVGAGSQERTENAGPKERTESAGPKEQIESAGSKEQIESAGSKEQIESAGAKERTESAGSKERTEGETQAVDQGTRRVSVKVTKLGPAPLVVAGTQVAVGETIWDDPLNWIPCN